MGLWIVDLLKTHPEIALFLTLAVGYTIGKIRFGTFQLGAVTGVLIAGVLIGQIGVKISADLKTAFFLLFLFAIGYKTGPQFFRGLKSSGLPQLALTTILCVAGLGMAYGAARIFGFDVGTAAGLVAGAMTESATVGTATDAINHLSMAADGKTGLISNVAVAFAVTYFLGVITVVVFLSKAAPKLMGVDLAAECAKLEQEMGVITVEDGVTSAYHTTIMRSYEMPSSLGEKTVTEIEAYFQPARIFVERVRCGSRLTPPDPDLVVRPGDRIVLSGRHEALVASANPAAKFEVEDRELLDIPMLTLEVMVTQKTAIGHALREFRDHAGARGVFVRKLTRSGQELPLTDRTMLDRGDVVTVTGSKDNVERVASRVGYADRATAATDVIPVMTTMVIGAVIGIPALTLGKLDIGLSESVGVLLGGIVFGWLRSVQHVPSTRGRRASDDRGHSRP